MFRLCFRPFESDSAKTGNNDKVTVQQVSSHEVANTCRANSHSNNQVANPLQRDLHSARISPDTSTQALCFHILAQSPSIISIFSDSSDGKAVYQNVKSLEYYGDLSKVETVKDTPSTFLHILDSLLSFEPLDDIHLGPVLSELLLTGSWAGSIKVPHRLHSEREDSDVSPAIEEADLLPIKVRRREPSLGLHLLDPQASVNLPDYTDEIENADSIGEEADPVISASIDLDQVAVVTATFRKVPMRFKSLVLPSFQSLLSDSIGSGRSVDHRTSNRDSPTKGKTVRTFSKQLSSLRGVARSATFDGKSTALDSQPALKIDNTYTVARDALETELPHLVEADALSKPPQVPPLEFESGAHGRNFNSLNEVDQEEMVSTLANVNRSTGSPFQWHDVSIKKLTHPVTGEPLILVTQNDVTVRVAMEKAMLVCAHTQLNMVSTIFPLHVVEFFNQQQDSKRSTHDVTEPDIGQLARSHKDVTILFMDIVGFTSMSKEVPPAVVMKFLNDLFGRFDHLLEVHKVHKVETAGDCYIVAAGVVSSGSDGFFEVLSSHNPHLSASRVLSFAQSMLQHSKTMRMPHNGEPVLVRIGIHTGDCVSGLVGSTLHKFGLFGDTMNTASRMESTCMPGRIQISASTYAMLPQDLQAQFLATGGVEVKGKGQMQTHLWIETSTLDILDSSGSDHPGGILGAESDAPQDHRPRGISAAQLTSLNIEEIVKSQSKDSGGPQRRPAFAAMTQASREAVRLLFANATESKTSTESSNLLLRMKSKRTTAVTPGRRLLGNSLIPQRGGPAAERRPLRKSFSSHNLSFSNPPNDEVPNAKH